MYFSNRVQAGRELAKQLKKYKDDHASVIALSDGGAIVGAQIASALHCPLMMLMTQPILAPGEPEAVASINQEGTYTYNGAYSTGEIEEFNMEYQQLFEQEKRDELSHMHRLLGKYSIIRKDLLRHHSVILVSDGLNSGFSLDAAVMYLKSTKINKLIIATPLASVPVVDRMHILGDELYCLSVVGNYIRTDHYYDDNSIPDHETIVKTIQELVLNWQK